jgi:hypothetical protein
MQGLYQAIGRIVGAAHAVGDTIDENVFPDGDGDKKHGVDLFHNQQLVMFRKASEEPRFTVDCPIPFARYLRRSYTNEELSERADVEFDSLPRDERDRVIDSTLQADLETISEYETDVRAAVQEEVSATAVDILRVSYGQNELWNGFVVRDRCFPYRESFGVTEYRNVVQRVVSNQKELERLAHERIPALDGQRNNSDATNISALSGYE